MPRQAQSSAANSKSVAGHSEKKTASPEEQPQGEFQSLVNNSEQVQQLQAFQQAADGRTRNLVQKKEANLLAGEMTSTEQARFTPPTSVPVQRAVVQLAGDPYPPDQYATMIALCRDNIAGEREQVVKKIRKVLYTEDWNLTATQVQELHALLAQAGTDEVEYMRTRLGIDYFEQAKIDNLNTFLEDKGHHLLPAQRTLVRNFLRRDGLNQDSEIDAYVDSLYENMSGVAGRPPRVQVSAMMTSVNARLTSIGYPPLQIVYQAGLENNNAANFHFRTWRIQIDEALLNNFNAGMANTLYHEARHSEQWFRMILIQQLLNERDDAAIAVHMSVPAEIVALARAKQATIAAFFPADQRLATYEYYESVYGAQGAARRATILGLAAPDAENYKRYRALPEEVDAWDTGGRVEKGIDKKVRTLGRQIRLGQDLTVVRGLCSQLNYYINLPAGKAEYIGNIKAFLAGLVKEIQKYRELERATRVDYRADMLRLAVKHNYLAQACGLTKITADEIFLNPDRSFQRSDWDEIGIAPSSIVQ